MQWMLDMCVQFRISNIMLNSKISMYFIPFSKFWQFKVIKLYLSYFMYIVNIIKIFYTFSKKLYMQLWNQSRIIQFTKLEYKNHIMLRQILFICFLKCYAMNGRYMCLVSNIHYNHIPIMNVKYWIFFQIL